MKNILTIALLLLSSFNVVLPYIILLTANAEQTDSINQIDGFDSLNCSGPDCSFIAPSPSDKPKNLLFRNEATQEVTYDSISVLADEDQSTENSPKRGCNIL